MRLTRTTRWIALAIVGIAAASAVALAPPANNGGIYVQGFRIAIEGLPTGPANEGGLYCEQDAFSCSFSPLVTKVEISDLVFPIIDTWDGQSPQRSYRPGPAEPVRVSLTLTRNAAQSTALEWWSRTMSGRREPREITVNVLDRAGEVSRIYTFRDCSPVAYTMNPISPPQTGHLTETLVVEAPRVAVSAFGSADRWASLSGGTKEMKVVEGGRSTVKSVHTQPIRIACNIAAPHAGLADWLEATLQGQIENRAVTQTLIDQEGNDVLVNQHPACFVHRLVFPKLDVDGSGPATEAIELQASGTVNSHG